MVKKMLKQKSTIGAILIFVLFNVGWIYMRYFIDADLKQEDFLGTYDREDILFGTYGLLALYGAVIGLIISKKWGGYKSYVGRSIVMFSLGLLAQVFGQIAYTVQGNILGEVPYPSIGDLGYMGSVFFYIYGVWMLAKTTGFHINISSLRNKLQSIVIPLVLLTASYYVFLRGYEFDWSAPLVVFLDFGYPLGQSLYIALAILVFSLSRKLLGGLMKPVIWFLLTALLVQYVADYTFLYSHAQGTWEVGGLNDYTYLVAYLIMTLALIGFGQITVGQQASERNESDDAS